MASLVNATIQLAWSQIYANQLAWSQLYSNQLAWSLIYPSEQNKLRPNENKLTLQHVSALANSEIGPIRSETGGVEQPH